MWAKAGGQEMKQQSKGGQKGDGRVEIRAEQVEQRESVGRNERRPVWQRQAQGSNE